MKKKIIFLATIVVFALCACNNQRDYASQEDGGVMYSLDLIDEGEEQTEQADTIARKIIKTGEIEFQTRDVNKTRLFINQVIAELNGYVLEDNIFQYSTELHHRLTIRIAADKFDLLLNNISENADKIVDKTIKLQDVTVEYIDVEARIKTKKELRNRYSELLKQATKVDEILNIEKEIGNLQTEIEAVEGRMKYLKDQVAYSTLKVEFYQKTPRNVAFFSEFADGLKSGWGVFLKFVVALSYVWVFIVIAVAVIYLFVRRRRRKRRNKKQLVD